MKKIFGILLLCVFIISCNEDKQSKLEKLEKQRDELSEKINKLKKELNSKKIIADNFIYVKAEKVQNRIFKHFIEIQGNVESDNNIFVPAQSPGVIQRIYVNRGDKVTKGQILAEQDASIILNGIEEVKTGLELATIIYEKQKRLWEKEIGSEIKYLQAKTQKESLEKKLQTLNEQYKLTKIISPIDGTIDEIAIKKGEAAAPGFGAIRVVQLTKLKVKAYLSENYITNIKKNDSVKIFIPSINKYFSTTIFAVSQVIDPDNRTFNIEISVPDNIKDIKPNMLAILTINDYTNPEALVVPVNVVQNSGGEIFLFVAKKNKKNWIAKKRIVKTGKYYNNKLEITENLNNGENVIIFGYQDLADGQIVSIVK
ncbi:MAG: efflux RND transporter periplasmic adaptor subunit [Bacteroidales bacterium]|nr:efflux RND transporter periplasmic adaptor subunit [Bacteroidales bacterium]